ncbi:MAG: hypothetical protein V4484_19575 [Pseudomonadota bacterium]
MSQVHTDISLTEKDQIEPERAFRLIEQVERGNIPLSEALRLIAAPLSETSAGDAIGTDQATLPEPPNPSAETVPDSPVADEPHKMVADQVERVSMGLGITSGIVTAGASLVAPTGLSAIGIALGITSAPLIVSAAPIVASVATAAGMVSGGTYFHSKWKSRKTKKSTEIKD